jgi:hypothetical protein
MVYVRYDDALETPTQSLEPLLDSFRVHQRPQPPLHGTAGVCRRVRVVTLAIWAQDPRRSCPLLPRGLIRGPDRFTDFKPVQKEDLNTWLVLIPIKELLGCLVIKGRGAPLYFGIQ